MGKGEGIMTDKEKQTQIEKSMKDYF